MVWAAVTNGVDEYLSVESISGDFPTIEVLGDGSFSYDIEIEGYCITTDFLVAPSTASTLNLILVRIASGDVEWRVGGNSYIFSSAVTTPTDIFKIRFEVRRVGSGSRNLELYVNDSPTPSGSFVITSGSPIFKYFGQVNSIYRDGGYISARLTDNNNSSNNIWLDSTASDHNSGSDPVLDPFTVIDLSGNGNDATGFNMTTANWIDLGGSGVVEFTFSINSASSALVESAFVVSSDFQAITSSVASFSSARVQQSSFDISSQSLTDFNSAKIQSSIFEIDSSSTFSVLTGDTNIVEFTFSVSSQSSLSVDSAKAQSSAFDIESQSNTGIESAKLQASGFNMDSGANVDWSASAIQGRTFAIDSESIFTVVVEGGEPVFIIGLTLELSSDIITLELNSEQEIRELA